MNIPFGDESQNLVFGKMKYDRMTIFFKLNLDLYMNICEMI